MFELLSIPRKSHHFVCLNASFRSDLLWWHVFLTPLYGVSLIHRFLPFQYHVQFATDASGSVDCGDVCPSWWLQLKRSDFHCSLATQRDEDSITFRELLLITLACAVWGPCWRAHSVVVHCDNMGAVAVMVKFICLSLLTFCVACGPHGRTVLVHVVGCLLYVLLWISEVGRRGGPF